MPALIPQLQNAIQYILDLNHPSGKAPLIGHHFVTRWLKRNLDYRHVKQRPQEVNRIAANVVSAYSRYFCELKEAIDEYGVQRGDTYNIDETGFRIGCEGS